MLNTQQDFQPRATSLCMYSQKNKNHELAMVGKDTHSHASTLDTVLKQNARDMVVCSSEQHEEMKLTSCASQLAGQMNDLVKSVCKTDIPLSHSVHENSQALSNAIVRGKIGLAYVFYGPHVQEGLEIDKDTLKLIATKSDGSLRDAKMTLDQLGLLEQRISLPLAQELLGLIPDEKRVDLLDLALSVDTVNTMKCLSETLSEEEMERLRQALKTLSEDDKQLQLSNDKTAWLTVALLQLGPDQSYMLPSPSVGQFVQVCSRPSMLRPYCILLPFGGQLFNMEKTRAFNLVEVAQLPMESE
eukprot:Gb_00151 [translate_table: standard]